MIGSNRKKVFMNNFKENILKKINEKTGNKFSSKSYREFFNIFTLKKYIRRITYDTEIVITDSFLEAADILYLSKISNINFGVDGKISEIVKLEYYLSQKEKDYFIVTDVVGKYSFITVCYSKDDKGQLFPAILLIYIKPDCEQEGKL
jgi:hypothetical protein